MTRKKVNSIHCCNQSKQTIMRKIFVFIAVISFQQIIAQKTISGFTEKSAAEQIALEQKFDGFISAEKIGATIKELSAKPHHISSPGGKEVAEKILAKYKSWGWDAKIETYNVLFPTPKTRVLEMTAPSVYKALLKEPGLKEDATSNQDGQLPTYNAWSADGDVTGDLVFVNYGLPSDYDELEKLGTDVKGKIVITKYGKSWRGIKPKVAYEHGAIGCIIYSDPKDDGYYQGEVYPKGAFKNEYGVQRGSVMDMVIYPGDPLTPGIGSIPNTKGLERSEAPTILKIPVLPISYHDAKPLLESLDGAVAPDDWRGALPFTYHVGGTNKTKVHLKLEFDWSIKPCYDVIAMIKGNIYPDEWVIRGNHHDAWVNGADDPISGQSALLEEARAIGELVKTGWKPKRTLVFCAWDGEEPGLLGSTEWAEDHIKELQQKAVLYINTDDYSRGFFNASGSHALENFMYEIAKDVKDPQTDVSLFDRSKAADALRATSATAKKNALQKKSLTLGALGSGSDYSSFLQHDGVPSLNLGFGGEGSGGEYHSIYDSYDDFSKFKDPGFIYGAALSKVAGRTALRMADADILPFDFRSLHKTVSSYVGELIELTNQLRESTAVENELIKNKVYQLANDPSKNLKAPTTKEEVPFIDFSPLQNAVASLEKATNHVNEVWTKSLTNTANADAFNQQLYKAEQQLLLNNGLPRRSWYKHSLYAPGFYTGYGVKTMPGVREALEQRNFKEAQEQITLAADAINKLSSYLNAIQ
jgi:N-acetylated-alpha-linked acidic dipeptidase